MNIYSVQIPFDNFQIGDEIRLNLRQAKYKLMTGHIIQKPDEVIAESKSVEISAGDEIPELTDIEGLDEEDIKFVKQHPHRPAKKSKQKEADE